MLQRLRTLLSNDRGMASIEFAILVPVMAMILFAIYELSQHVRVQQKVDNAAQSIADMVAQQAAGVTGGTSGTLGNFCAAGGLMMTPFAAGTGASNFSAAIASVTNNASGGVAVDWESDNACGTSVAAIRPGAPALVTAPVNLVPTPGDSVIVVQVSYVYDSPLQYLFPGLVTLTHTAFARPRNNGVIACGTPCT